MFKWYPLLYDEKRSRDVLNDKQTELSGGARMREIKFRGKRIDDGEWVVGDLTRYSNVKSIIVVDLVEGEEPWVLTETVGQYTGLKDKNEIGIYEGDVVGKNGYWSFIVEFDNGSFRLNPLDIVQSRNWEHRTLTNEWLLIGFEVLGNIYDNPELLEVQE